MKRSAADCGEGYAATKRACCYMDSISGWHGVPPPIGAVPRVARDPSPHRSPAAAFPREVWSVVCRYLDVPGLARLQLTCRTLHRVVPGAIEELDLSRYTDAYGGGGRGLPEHGGRVLPCPLLAGWAARGMKLRALTLPAGLDEKYSGVVGFVLRAARGRLQRLDAGVGATTSRLLSELALSGAPALLDFHHRTSCGAADRFYCASPPRPASVAALLNAAPLLRTAAVGSTFAPEVPCYDDSELMGGGFDGHGPGELSRLVYPAAAAPAEAAPVAHACLEGLELDDVVLGDFEEAGAPRLRLPNLKRLALKEAWRPAAPAADGAPPQGGGVLKRLGVHALTAAEGQRLEHLSVCTYRSPVPLEAGELKDLVARVPTLKSLALGTMRRRKPLTNELELAPAEDDDEWGDEADAAAPPLSAAGLAGLIEGLPGLTSLVVDHKGWSWFSPGAGVLVLTSGAAELTQVLLGAVRRAPRVNFFTQLTHVALYGAMGNEPVRAVLAHCPKLFALEAYFLPGAVVDDDLLAGVAAPNLAFLKIHDASVGDGLGHLLSADLFRRCAFAAAFPRLWELSVMGITASPRDAVQRHAPPMDAVAMALSEIALPCLDTLSLGPILHTSSALLTLLAALADTSPRFRSLAVAWCAGAFPHADDNAMNVLGLATLAKVARAVNPKVTVTEAVLGFPRRRGR